MLNLKIIFENRIQGQPIVLYDSSYTNPFGENYIINKIRYSISNIHLENNKGISTINKASYLVDEANNDSKEIDHDGRFYSLGQVIEHSRDGIQQSPTLDSSLRQGKEFTKLEKYDLIIFPNTLTDTIFLKNKRYGAPDGNTPLVLSH